jgi:hypothetical protein
MVTDYGAPIRKALVESAHIDYIVDFGDKQIFEGASTYTCILVVQKSQNAKKTDVRVVDTEPGQSVLAPNVLRGVRDIKIDMKAFGTKPWEWHGSTIGKSRDGFRKLTDICEIFQGIRTSDDHVFVLNNPEFKGKYVTGFSKALNERVTVEAEMTRPFLKGREIGRNAHGPVNNVLIFPYESTDPYELLSWSSLKREYPKTAAYFESTKSRLRARQRGKYDLSKWYGFIRTQNHDLMSEQKVMIQAMSARAHMTFDPKGECFFVTGYGLFIKDKAARNAAHYQFIQALLKTDHNDRQVQSRTSKLRGGFSEYRKQFLADLLIPDFNKSNKLHEKIVALQEEVASLARKRNAVTSEGARKELEHFIGEAEAKIEELAKKLYDAPEREAA